jgi:dTDP-4-dehydrorhamnose reductase
MTRVLVLGANGMLGSMVAKVLASHRELEVVGSTRQGSDAPLEFDSSRDSIAELLESVHCDWVVNAIGILDSRIDEDDPESVASAIDTNATFPNRLAAAAGDRGVIQISTDGVFSGRNPPYGERALHDATGVYARSKSLGEVSSPGFVNLRCSIIGPEDPPARSLLGWAMSQPPGATITGYTNHRWNGITTFHFAKLCAGVILGDRFELPTVLHVVPGDAVDKAELLGLLLSAFGRGDVTVLPEPAPAPMDRTLCTEYPKVNGRLWAAAGYRRPPTIEKMVRELSVVAQ